MQFDNKGLLYLLYCVGFFNDQIFICNQNEVLSTYTLPDNYFGFNYLSIDQSDNLYISYSNTDNPIEIMDWNYQSEGDVVLSYKHPDFKPLGDTNISWNCTEPSGTDIECYVYGGSATNDTWAGPFKESGISFNFQEDDTIKLKFVLKKLYTK